MLSKLLVHLKPTLIGVGFIAASLVSGCEKDKSTSPSSLQGTQWMLQATINCHSGELVRFQNTKSITLAFNNGNMYEFSAGGKNISSHCLLNPRKGKVVYDMPSKEDIRSTRAESILRAFLNSTEYEVIGSTLKLIDSKTNNFLIFERIK